jgi:hypothetical protein
MSAFVRTPRFLAVVVGLVLPLASCADRAVEAEPSASACADARAPEADVDLGEGGGDPSRCLEGLAVERVSPGEGTAALTMPGCFFASPLTVLEGAERRIVVASASGAVAALRPDGSDFEWSVTMPAPAGEIAFVVATPVAVDRRLVVSYHTRPESSDHDVAGPRIRHRVAVIDLDRKALDPKFPPIELAASLPGNGGDVRFEGPHALGRGSLVHVARSGAALGLVYATFGNVRDIQPWHGWIFEIDLDAWSAGSTSPTTAFVSTPEADCGPRGQSGSRERRCGGGLWAPSGPLVDDGPDGPSLVVSTGNGQLDLRRGDFANSLLRLRPGLAFDPGCDPSACADFDPDAPAEACTSSCRDLFVPRLLAGQAFAPESGVCEGLGLFECWQRLDYIGGSTPERVRIGTRSGYVYPAKDGAVYLIDRERLGALHDRRQLVDVCGTKTDPCAMDWAGMIVTQPAVVRAGPGPTGPDGDEDLVLVPTFMPDRTHPAGVVALRVVAAERPRLEPAWTWPPFSAPEAITRFRKHPSRIVISKVDRTDVAWLVEPGGPGRLIALSAKSGALLADVPLAGPGYRFVKPLVDGDRIYVPSCATERGPGTIEIHRFSPR